MLRLCCYNNLAEWKLLNLSWSSQKEKFYNRPSSLAYFPRAWRCRVFIVRCTFTVISAALLFWKYTPQKKKLFFFTWVQFWCVALWSQCGARRLHGTHRQRSCLLGFHIAWSSGTKWESTQAEPEKQALFYPQPDDKTWVKKNVIRVKRCHNSSQKVLTIRPCVATVSCMVNIYFTTLKGILERRSLSNKPSHLLVLRVHLFSPTRSFGIPVQ